MVTGLSSESIRLWIREVVFLRPFLEGNGKTLRN